MLALPSIAAAILASLPAPSAQQQDLRALVRPITGNLHVRTMRVDPTTGRAVRVPSAIANGALEPVFDNTCPTGYWNALNTQSQNGAGSTGPMAAGDWGALPSTDYDGYAPSFWGPTCTPGCADSYAIGAFTIAYCTTGSTPVDMVLHFWDRTATGGSGLNACDGVQLIGGAVPPAVPRAPYPSSPTGMADFTVTGLPRNSTTGPPGSQLSGCYAIQLVIDTPGFVLNGGSVGLTSLGTTGDRFAWSMQVLNGTGATGPIYAGNASFGTPCRWCTGTIWDAGSSPVATGIGLGQTNVIWLDTYGGNSPSTGNCYFFGGNPWSGFRMQLAALDPCGGVDGFCNASDGAWTACPCGNVGRADTGCDNAQGTGGVSVSALAQTTGANGATLVGSGFPALASPTAIVLRSNVLDAAAPVVFGDGLRCLATAGLVRLAASAATGGTSQHAIGHGAGAGQFHYQLWYRNTPSTFCDPLSAFNLSDGLSLTW